MSEKTILIIILALVATTIIVSVLPNIIKICASASKKSNYSKLGSSSKIRLVREITAAVEELSEKRIGALITIANKDKLDFHRTDGIRLDANISSSLIVTIFNKHSKLHDGAIIIEENKIIFAGTYYSISNKSLRNMPGSNGARHRAALGISEQTDAISIIISESTGKISFAIDGMLVLIKKAEFQEKFTEILTSRKINVSKSSNKK